MLQKRGGELHQKRRELPIMFTMSDISQETAMPNDSPTTEINQYTLDKDYDLISVLYHALQAADTSAQYRQDAESQGSSDVAEFMREVQEQNSRIAQQAKDLLFRQKQV
jgi:hypothetical protein